MGSRFNWWRRSKKKAPLKRRDAEKGKSFLLQQIEHGDFDHSDYLNQARNELVLSEQEQELIKSKWRAGAESLRERLDQVERKYIKRHNKLLEDYHKDENRLLQTIKERLLLEFKVDVWDEALVLERDQDLIKLFHNYKTLAQKNKTSKHEKGTL